MAREQKPQLSQNSCMSKPVKVNEISTDVIPYLCFSVHQATTFLSVHQATVSPE